MSNSFKHTLSDQEEKDVFHFLSNLSYCSVLQNPHWNRAINKKKNVCYYIEKNEDKIVCFSLIVENFWSAKIMFGPCSEDSNILADAILKIHEYYKRKGFAALEIQQGMPLSQKTEETDYFVRKRVNFSQAISEENWTTILISLKDETDNIFESFSKNHKRSITKARNNGLKPVALTEMADIEKFSWLFDKMYDRRKLLKPFENSPLVFREIFELFQNEMKGFFIGVFTPDNELVGGACFTICNDTIMYQYGCTDARSNLPILHLAFFEAISMAKTMNVKQFDLCGINLMVKESDQVFKINRFKSGFNGVVVYYPRKMTFNLNAFKVFLLKGAKCAYNFFRRV
ncbi:MAG TPA: hypothetical protein VLH37_10645 [Bacteroidales bacterium]|nr:hypothetical protein [Bacteroidales bacterium]